MKSYIVLITLGAFLFFPHVTFATSDYLLPYPPIMPGGALYKVRVLAEKIGEYWNFGNLAQFKFHLSLSDKYLVQAKTLFEYKQFLLAKESLEESNVYIKKAKKDLDNGFLHGKNISQYKSRFNSALEKHNEVLTTIRVNNPKEVVWTPEKSTPILIEVEKLISQSVDIRKNLRE